MPTNPTLTTALVWLAVGLAYGWVPALWTLVLVGPLLSLSGIALGPVARDARRDTLQDVRERAKRTHPAGGGR